MSHVRSAAGAAIDHDHEQPPKAPRDHREASFTIFDLTKAIYNFSEKLAVPLR
jgi:hypothetical protein